jgi:hypothetical protein
MFKQLKKYTSSAGWKCVVSTRTLYSPSYSESRSTGKYTFETLASTGPNAIKNCLDKKGSLVQPSGGDALETLLGNYNAGEAFVRKMKKN